MQKLKKALPYLLPPLGVILLILFIYYKDHMYPFGEGSITWCDMTQQSIPLLTDLKDILEGKDSLFLNMHNAGGMNFYGVFFFFLSSPFSFLVKFVPKERMIFFMNILVMMKLSISAFTAQIYFRRSFKKLSPVTTGALSVMYALCGFGLLFYQNQMWLDIMYLFPLLMLALERLVKRHDNIPYIIVLSCMIVMNYYLSYMAAIFILMFAGAHIVLSEKGKDTSLISVKFITGTLISFMLTAAVWLPSYLQVRDSARQEKTFKDTIIDGNFLTAYTTVLPMLFCSAFIFVAVGGAVLAGRKRSSALKKDLILLVLTLLPFFIEPINIMWHTGNYQSFPARYGYITIFIGLICTAEVLQDDIPAPAAESAKTSKFNIDPVKLIWIALPLLLARWMIKFSAAFFEEQFDKGITAFVDTLWGNTKSLDIISSLFVLTVACYAFIYILYRCGKISKTVFPVLLAVFCAVEGYNNMHLYLTAPSIRNPVRVPDYADVFAMTDRIDDDSFYRVMTDRKITDYNSIGALGYPTLAHYTSLTNEDFLFTQKRLGYTTVWMESGSQGGTELTNALYDVKYKILRQEPSENSIYYSDVYTIEPQPLSVGLGILTADPLTNQTDIPAGLTRAQVQQYLFSQLCGADKQLITEYGYLPEESRDIEYVDGRYNISSGSAVYRFHVNGKQILYADCFDKLSNALSESYFSSFNVILNGETIRTDYPANHDNGVLRLGEFEDQDVEIRLDCRKNISVYSFGVFGIDSNMLTEGINSLESADLNYSKGRIYGSCDLSEARTCTVTVPFNQGFTVKVNGKETDYRRVFSDFIAFDLEPGQNDISITFVPLGFYTSLAISIAGAVLLAVYIIKGRKIELPKAVCKAADMLTTLVILTGFIIIYIYPILIKLLEKKIE